MPVLDKEFSLWPNNLFDATANLDGTQREWSVLHTRPRTEKSLARRLVKNDVAFFLPLHERRERYQRRLVRSYLPLFPGYVFLWGTEEARREAFATNYVVNCLHVADQAQLDGELKQIHELIETGVPLSPEEQLQPGMAAEIVKGSLAGHRGKVVRKSGTEMAKFIVEVEMLNQGVSAEVEEWMVRPLR